MRPIADHNAEHASADGGEPAVDAQDRKIQDGAMPGRDGSPIEIGGRKGPEPTRFGDWERKGRCIDF